MINRNYSEFYFSTLTNYLDQNSLSIFKTEVVEMRLETCREAPDLAVTVLLREIKSKFTLGASKNFSFY